MALVSLQFSSGRKEQQWLAIPSFAEITWAKLLTLVKLLAQFRCNQMHTRHGYLKKNAGLRKFNKASGICLVFFEIMGIQYVFLREQLSRPDFLVIFFFVVVKLSLLSRALGCQMVPQYQPKIERESETEKLIPRNSWRRFRVRFEWPQGGQGRVQAKS